MSPRAPICFVNATLGEKVTTLRVVGESIADLGAQPVRGDRVVDLAGARLLPGLINAHDHLQFDNFARTRFRDSHTNVAEWVADVTAHRHRDPQLIAGIALDIESRLFAGGLKNLLSGATTVAHHDPYHAAFDAPDFPVRVLRRYGWAHSLGVDREAGVTGSYHATPANRPWIVHAGEGVDEAAREEFARLEALGCVRQNTLLVHALGFDAPQMSRLIAAEAAVIWCPASNVYLFGRTLDPLELAVAGRLAIGSDSRLSGARDLLDELRAARDASPGSAPFLEMAVTLHNARLLRLEDRGSLTPGALADLVVLPRRPLADVRRADLRMVMVGGEMRYGDADLAAALAPDADCAEVVVDGASKVLAHRLVERIGALHWREPGLSLRAASWRAA
jgi:cytosine/adenosine deaminase-related metal-dependent hydrolase